MSASAPAPAALEPEDEARAGVYGLIARLFYAPPDAGTIAHILHAPAFEGGADALGEAWRGIVDACRNAFPVMIENEHTELFIGTGAAEVTPYLAHYARASDGRNLLVALRDQLGVWHIGRRPNVTEPEDHIAGVCDAMRFAIATQHRPDAEQKAFFEAFLYPGAVPFCDAVTGSNKASFYRHVAAFARAFFEIEHDAFGLLE